MHTVKIFYLNSEEFLIKMGKKRLLEYSEGRVFKSEKRMVQFCLGRFLIKHVLENKYGIHSPVISVQNRKPYLENGDIKYVDLSTSNVLNENLVANDNIIANNIVRIENVVTVDNNKETNTIIVISNDGTSYNVQDLI